MLIDHESALIFFPITFLLLPICEPSILGRAIPSFFQAQAYLNAELSSNNEKHRECLIPCLAVSACPQCCFLPEYERANRL